MKICTTAFAAFILFGTFPLGSRAEESGSSTDNNCLLPANIRDKGFKCNSVGDFGEDKSRTYPGAAVLPDFGNKALLMAHVMDGKDLTVVGVIISNDASAPRILAWKFGNHGEVFRLINYKEEFPKNAKVEITGKLQFAPAHSAQNEHAPSTSGYYYFDCAHSKIRQLGLVK